MIADLKPYLEYKASSQAWLGDVPQHWSVVPNRALFAEVKDRNHPDEEMLSVTITQGIVRQKALLEGSSKKDSSNHDKSAYKLVQPRDIAYNKMRAWQGAIGASALRGIISPAYVVMRLRKDDDLPGYFHHIYRTPQFAKEAERWSYGITSDMWSLRPEHFKMIYTPEPPPSEQAAIVRFLDWANGRLERAIRAKRKVIALLNEQKQAIIHRAVTCGLDPSVPLKPSGIPWLGDIPYHWEVRQLGRFITLQRGFDITKMQQKPGLIPVVSSGGASSFHNKFTSPGPGVILGRKGSVGALHFVDGPYWAHDTTLWVKDFGGNHPRLVYYLLSLLHLKRFDTGSSNPTLNRNLVHPEMVCFPPIKEQESIAVFLDDVVRKTERNILRLEREIELLREYRTRLIADVVTGKLDVREAAARLPEEHDKSDLSDLSVLDDNADEPEQEDES
jgi:type I restriction enzyme, S subunit